MRRAEVLALRWSDVDLKAGKLKVRRNYVRVNGRAIEKDTKTHQMRRISLDPATVEVLAEHRQRYEAIARQISIEPTDRAFLFYTSQHTTDRTTQVLSPIGTATCAPNSASTAIYMPCGTIQPPNCLPRRRPSAGRLGHGGGGATTLRVYAAWAGESDRRAA
ncbi:MAG TPA: hypothetical protein VF734_12250 [Pseudonocardiaceae bacterium]